MTARPHHRVGWNLLWLVPGVVGGSEEYAIGLLRAWVREARDLEDLELVLFVNERFAPSYPDLARELRCVVAPVSGRSKAVRVAAESTWLAWRSRRERLSLLHHLGGTMPVVRTSPGIVTIHDLQPWVLPENFHPVKRAYLRLTVPRSVQAAAAVVTLSAWVRDDVARRLGVPSSRITPVLPEVPPAPETSAVPSADVLRAYDLLDRPFLLYPAITYPHKNHLTLLRAFALAVRSDPESVLVLTAGSGSSERACRRLIQELGIGRQVRRTGRIPVEHLDVLYREARALTFPSRYEGFGLPVIEAMVRGCPVLASDAAALPEVVGDGGELLEPDDVQAWAGAIRRVLDDEGFRAGLARRASTRAAALRRGDAPQRLAEVYRRAIAASARSAS
ncbi:MAG: glycosyltransferase family 1 protein [Acidimicrobiales bacterium]